MDSFILKMLKTSFLVFIIIPFFSCSGNDDRSNSSGNFRFVQLAPNSPTLSVLVNNESVLNNIDFLENSGFIKGPKEDFNLKLTSTDSENPVITSFINTNFESIQNTMTFVSTGLYRSFPSTNIIAIATDRIPADANEVEIKWAHAAFDLSNQAFDIYVLPKDNDCNELSNQFATVENLSYGQSSAGYNTLDSGTFDICLVMKNLNTEAILLNNYSFQSRMKVTLILFQEPETLRLGFYILDDVTGDEEVVFP